MTTSNITIWYGKVHGIQTFAYVIKNLEVRKLSLGIQNPRTSFWKSASTEMEDGILQLERRIDDMESSI